ncbi:MAG: aminomethyl-transferring glycine dehydrogenase subunit GcvPA [Actinomycetota bacterium]|nr:aminomethyl-transferring glycine dehydrogenase subunit GcvPA [Actinomycetota bacterium]
MDFVPHTADDDREMLEAIGLESIDGLFDPIPEGVRPDSDLDLPAPLSEPELLDHLARLAARCATGPALTCFAGGGAYDHHLPPVVKALAARSEFSTSYTPYQPELSQGVLQALFEFQSLVCEIYGMEVANASLYDGASAVVEAVNLAVRSTKRTRVLVGATVHPHHRAVLQTYTSGLELDVVTVPFGDDGTCRWSEADLDNAACVVVAYPNFFGLLEDGRAAARRAHDAGALAVAVADPTAMGILASPGEQGFDLAVGEGQSLGNPLSYGGPYVGLFSTKLDLIRQVPGRISGETTDADGRRAFVLTLQAREQHIRRAKATSNVCTNQTLMAIFASVYLSWLGPTGLRRLGEICLRRSAAAAARISEIPGCSLAFEGPRFKEFVLRTPVPAERLAQGLSRRGFLAGPALGRWYPDLADCLLVAVTERRSLADVNALAEAIEKELAEA